MIQRQTDSSSVGYYSSSLLRAIEVPHGFSTRIGGISPAPFDSLNLGNPNGCEIQDDYDRIWRNYELLLNATGCAGRSMVRVHQVHGPVVARVESHAEFDLNTKADALVTADRTRALTIRVADCVPVLLASEDGKIVSAAHAGWRGVISGVVPAAIAAMSVDPKDIVVAIGPCIGFDAFEVGSEVLAEFVRVFGPAAPIFKREDGKGHVDLRAAIALQLTEIGILADRIDRSDRCTYRDADEFFSHRRENGITGRMAAVIGTK